ncbi:hypothetical protein GCM10010231_31130 [Streptomyces sindenensis]|nr:hypothetical protein GCM10010231_31130 [Streptomyces sindenensis]
MRDGPTGEPVVGSADSRPYCSPPPGDDAETGRGLLIVEAPADHWGIPPGPVPRKTVWAEIGLVR